MYYHYSLYRMLVLELYERSDEDATTARSRVAFTVRSRNLKFDSIANAAAARRGAAQRVNNIICTRIICNRYCELRVYSYVEVHG